MWTDVGSQSLPSSAILLHEPRQTICQAFGIAWSCLHLYLQQMWANGEASLMRCNVSCIVSMMMYAQQGGNGMQCAEEIEQKKKKKPDLVKSNDNQQSSLCDLDQTTS